MTLSRLVFLFGIGAAAAIATPTTYDITFTGGSPTPTAGSFTYDPTLSANNFSKFLVTVDGLVLDLTFSANAPYVQGACQFTPADSFDMLEFATCAQNTQPLADTWQYSTNLGLQTIELVGLGAQGTVVIATNGSIGNLQTLTTTGSFTVTAVPEPSAGAISVAGFASMLVWAVRRGRKMAAPR